MEIHLKKAEKLHNDLLFNTVRKLNLSMGKFAIAATGAMAIRGIKKASDIDIIVTDDYWDLLIKKYEFTNLDHGKGSVIKIDNNIEIIHFDYDPKIGPSDKEQIERADIIEGLPFMSLRDVLYWKNIMGREKDIIDIKNINNYLQKHPKEA